VLENSKNLPVHFVGSVASFFEEEIRYSAAQLGLNLGNIQKDPMPGLIVYHQ
jgi:GMP synthase PP-ATPase subunit